MIHRIVIAWALFASWGAIGIAQPPARGTIETVAGTGAAEPNGDRGPANLMNIGQTFGVEIGPGEALYVTEVQNHRVWRVDLRTEQAEVVAGDGTRGYSGDGGPATRAQLNEPYEVRFDRDGNMYFVEMQNHIVRRVDRKTGIISTVAGTGEKGFGGDGGPATQAQFSDPHSIALDDSGGLYIADIGNHRIRRLDLKTGLVDSIAGNGGRSLPVSGQPAKDHAVFGPRALFLTGQTLWVALREGHSVWSLDLDQGTWKHIAGTGKEGFSGDGGAALEATFNGPKGIAVGPGNNLYVVDTENMVIRDVDLASGKIRTVAGRGPEHAGGGGDGGPATRAELDRPHGVCVGRDGVLYIGDTLNHKVRRVRLE